MKKIYTLKELQTFNAEVALTIGNYDGIHKGHQRLLWELNKIAKSRNLLSCVMTFSPHPKLFLNPSMQNYLINSYQERDKLLERYGVDVVCELVFDEELRNTSAKDFIDNYLLSCHCIKSIHLGHDFSLGMGKEDAYSYLEMAASDIHVSRQPTVEVGGLICSSSMIRNLLENGDVKKVNELLGREFFIYGTVVSGLGLGQKELVPTANLAWNISRIIPKNGVYFTYTTVDGKRYDSITNIGHSPTVVDAGEKRIETYLLDYNQNIYSKEIHVDFLAFHRNEEKFKSKEELLTKINLDIKMRRDFNA